MGKIKLMKLLDNIEFEYYYIKHYLEDKYYLIKRYLINIYLYRKELSTCYPYSENYGLLRRHIELLRDSKINGFEEESSAKEKIKRMDRAKIWFAYKMNNGNPQPDGRQEFVTETKEQLISEIQDFMKSDKVGWCIL